MIFLFNFTGKPIERLKGGVSACPLCINEECVLIMHDLLFVNTKSWFSRVCMLHSKEAVAVSEV